MQTHLLTFSLSLFSADKTLFLFATLAVSICLMDAVPVYSSMGELSETSGYEVQDVDGKSPLNDRQKWHLMARDLHKDVKNLRDEQVLLNAE